MSDIVLRKHEIYLFFYKYFHTAIAFFVRIWYNSKKKGDRP